MKPVKIVIDGLIVEAEAGQPVLWAAEKAGVFIPRLCALAEFSGSGGRCRLCWVEVDGEKRPGLACLTPAREGLNIKTRSPAVDRLVARAFALILSRHQLDCARCPASHRCRLQDIARRRRLSLRPKGLSLSVPPGLPDESRPELGLDPGKCVLCALCVQVCRQVVKKGVIDIVGRGLTARVGTYGDRPLIESGCGDCTACVAVCPTGAIYLRSAP